MHGKTVAITGAARGIGRSIAMRFLKDGANVVIGDKDRAGAEAAAAALGAEGHPVRAAGMDVSVAADCQAFVELCVREFGALDVMICNAGIIEMAPFLEVGSEEWDRTMAINGRGTFLSIQAAARRMLAQPRPADRPRGKIICISSIAGRYGAGGMSPFMPHYRASKAAVISIAQTAAQGLAPDITVNTICPGLVDTAMWERIDKRWADMTGVEIGATWQDRVSKIPMGRAQTGEDVAGVCSFLAGPDSDYITGQSINVDGGLTMS